MASRPNVLPHPERIFMLLWMTVVKFGPPIPCGAGECRDALAAFASTRATQVTPTELGYWRDSQRQLWPRAICPSNQSPCQKLHKSLQGGFGGRPLDYLKNSLSRSLTHWFRSSAISSHCLFIRAVDSIKLSPFHTFPKKPSGTIGTTSLYVPLERMMS
jgi:hypothetical protein